MTSERRLRLVIIARVVVTVLFLVSTIVLQIQEPEAISVGAFKGILQLMAFSSLFSAASLAVLKKESWRSATIYLQIIWDVIFVTILLVLTEGVASPYSFLYLLAIMNAGMFLSRKQALYVAAVCGIVFGTLIDLQYYGVLLKFGLNPMDAQIRGGGVLFYSIFLHVTGFILAAVITGNLTERARLSEDALQVTEVNYVELERLYRTIVSSIDTGLVTINMQGEIRVFNPYAEQLTGISQLEAYGRHYSSLFPHLKLDLDLKPPNRNGEFEFISNAGKHLTIGYSLAPYEDMHGVLSGLIASIKDLTEIKRMESALKKADRLAAVGELSARMAHEIRNPLAAISGSVQLLADHGNLADHEARLLNIVTRESERLNRLISEFLIYARPGRPVFKTVAIAELVDDLFLLLKGESRLSNINLVAELENGLEIEADQGQLQQVLLNLIRNSVDAMPEGGDILLQARHELAEPAGATDAAFVVLSVSDRGEGLSEEARQHLFEPFWTSRAQGTGLGLATVYRIIEGHNGSIQATAREGGGTVFSIRLPIGQAEG